MNALRILSIALASSLATATLAPIAHAGDYAGSKQTQAAGDIVAVASGAGQFGTLVAAVQAAGLVETLQGPGPFTVFAPTDAAFAALPAGTVEDLLKPENRDRLVAVLTYHVVPGKVTAEQVVGLDRATTVNGADVSIATRGDTVTVNGARVVSADVMASNGVIHVIDQVILPPAG
ncbi:MAG: fasciclin domain-containing protein [Xanthomonadales bacterium]|nr:fasciclin domain-containing protein [Xanthomonadales bacterium]